MLRVLGVRLPVLSCFFLQACGLHEQQRQRSANAPILEGLLDELSKELVSFRNLFLGNMLAL